MPDNPSKPPDESISDELLAEHNRLEGHPHDVAAHQAHRDRLREPVQKLRAHIERLRRHK